MKDPDATMEESYHIWDASVAANYDRVFDIMDAKYEAADLRKNVGTCTHLMLDEQDKIIYASEGVRRFIRWDIRSLDRKALSH